MHKLLTFLLPARTWLELHGGAGTSFGALCVVLFITMLGLRKWAPTAKVWERVASVFPALDFDMTPGLALLSKMWQGAFPTIVAAILGALASGGNPWVAVVAALAGPVTVFGHEFLKWLPFLPYRGAVNPKALPVSVAAKAKDDDDDKTPPRVPPSVVAASTGLLAICFLAGCGFFASKGVTWPKLAADCAPSDAKLVSQIEAILLAGGDYEKGLGDLTKGLENDALTDAESAVECGVAQAVQALLASNGKIGANPSDAPAAERGQAFLKKVSTQ